MGISFLRETRKGRERDGVEVSEPSGGYEKSLVHLYTVWVRKSLRRGGVVGWVESWKTRSAEDII